MCPVASGRATRRGQESVGHEEPSPCEGELPPKPLVCRKDQLGNAGGKQRVDDMPQATKMRAFYLYLNTTTLLKH